MKKDPKGLIAAGFATIGILWSALAAGKLYSVYSNKKKNTKEPPADKNDQGGK